MCNFLSAVVMKNGDVVCQPEHTDHHSHLLLKLGLKDEGDSRQRGWVRVEFLPPAEGDWGDLSLWTLTLDEEYSPGWWSEVGFQDRVRTKLERIVQAMIVRDKRPILLGGCWILLDGAEVEYAQNCRIVTMRGSSRVGEMWESSRVGAMRESSRVGAMRESSRVGAMWGSSQVGAMWESSRVGAMWGSSQVGVMLGSSKVGEDRRTKGVTDGR